MNLKNNAKGVLGIALCLLGVFLAATYLKGLHPLIQDTAYHHFADRRTLMGVHNAFDVLSNLGMAIVGVIGLRGLLTDTHKDIRNPVILFFGGLILTAAGSGYYHWNPNNQTLFWDRLPMAISFAGVLALLGRCAARHYFSVWSDLVLLVGACATVVWWKMTGDLWPYVALQFGGLLLILGIGLRKTTLGRGGWSAVLAWYVFAKVAESADRLLWLALYHQLSGHSIKHLAAAGAGLAVYRLCQGLVFSRDSR